MHYSPFVSTNVDLTKLWHKAWMINNQTESDVSDKIEAFLRELVQVVESEKSSTTEKPKGRPPILPALVLWSGVIAGVLRGAPSQREIWRLVGVDGLWNYPIYRVSDKAVYARLESGGTHGLERLFELVRDALKERLQPFNQKTIAPFASGVYAIDGSTLDKVRRHLPPLHDVPAEDSQLLAGKMVGVFNIRLQQWQEAIYLPNPNQNDKTVARDLTQQLPAQSLILGDMGFFGYAWFDWMTDNNFYWLSRVREKTSFEVQHTLYEDENLFDGIVWLGKHRADRASHAVRLVTFTLGQTQFRYITNVLDPMVLSVQAIAELYARRWDIELAFKLIKKHLKLHLIWSAKPVIIMQQLWAVLTVSQILHATQMEIAGRAHVDPFDVSLELVVRHVPRMAREGKDFIRILVENGAYFGFIRPSRRIRPQTPPVDSEKIVPLPPDLILKRTPRYAQRRCNPSTALGSNTERNQSSGVDWFPYR